MCFHPFHLAIHWLDSSCPREQESNKREESSGETAVITQSGSGSLCGCQLFPYWCSVDLTWHRLWDPVTFHLLNLFSVFILSWLRSVLTSNEFSSIYVRVVDSINLPCHCFSEKQLFSKAVMVFKYSTCFFNVCWRLWGRLR